MPREVLVVEGQATDVTLIRDAVPDAFGSDG